MVDPELARRAKILLDQLSEAPRFAGSDEEARARTVCRTELESSGFACRELSFDFSEAPGRWGPPLAAAVQVGTIITVGETALRAGTFFALLLGAILLTGFFFADARAKQRSVISFPFLRAQSVNLEARRGNARVWLVAHLDSKSQMVPMLLRIASSIALFAVMAFAVVVLLVSFFGYAATLGIWRGIEVAALIAALPSLVCFVRNKSSGALDNATGVVAVMLAAQSATTPFDIGVLITSGEELGLAGARAWAPTAPPDATGLNCDTVDDAGGWRCMYTGARPSRVLTLAQSTGTRLGLRLSIGRLIPGILADSIALADWGIDAVTLSRGTLSTLARIHTRRDNSSVMTGAGAAEASALLSALAKELA
ncbi:MAG: M28 family peptidase [Gemmatimonadaceae bacterium]